MNAKVEIVIHYTLTYNSASIIIKIWPILFHLDSYMNFRNAFIDDRV